MKKILFAIILSFLSFNLYAQKVALTWDSNTEEDLSHYNVYTGTSRENLYKVSRDVRLTSYSIDSIINESSSDSTVEYLYFAVTAVDYGLNESELSDIVSYKIDNTPPSKVKNLKIRVIVDGKEVNIIVEKK